MTDQLDVDLALLDSIADRLSRAGDALTSTGTPATPDAGEATAMIAELLATVSANVTNLAGGLRAASGRVAEAGRTYDAEDLTNAGQLRAVP
ncbi:hypothetical protein [Actinoplanes sp. L3-i22]|uniref:hypothetical protein n=1 Tax=Actinoplanes sp. L3-i22 TaxID=2836373 RepID=UPI001C74282E|nr:hypothetical protein [Actinoplanes sp. L3-i22]BCY11194.1 hypothetical protein L3i22_062820 [Actinoplanes sp. L3-i22]